MPLSNPFRRQSERPTLWERAAELRASLHASRPQQTSAPTAVQESAATADPIFAAIKNHVAAREAFSAVCPGIDKDARREQGLDTSDEAMAPTQAAWDAGNKEEIAAWNAVFETRPTTLAGALAMVRHAQKWAPENYGMDGAILLKGVFGALAEGLAGAIEAEAAPGKLVRDILDGWAAWGLVVNKIDDSPEGTAAWDRSDAQRNRLLDAAMALPATPENIAPKALACAWMEWVSVERPGQPRDAYGPADRLVYDIHATIMGQGVEAGGDERANETATGVEAVSGLRGLDFGPDTHIAELAAKFCEAYAANMKADRAAMAGQISEAEWMPHYREADRLMKELETTAPKTMLGMALKCLGPIGAAGYNAPADREEVQADAWDRVGTQFANAVLRGTLAPLPTADWHASPVDLIAAAGLSVETLPVSDLCSMLNAAEILSGVAAAITCQPRQMTKGSFNGAGRLIEETAFALHRTIDVVAKELRRRTPDSERDQACRLAALASLTIHNDDETETAAFARELLAMVEP